MFKYLVEFSKYKLRDYEKKLAVLEFENQFPFIEKKDIKENGIEFTADNILDEIKLKNLTFFSTIIYSNSHSLNYTFFTNQVILENYSKFEPSLMENITPNKVRNIRYLTHSLHEYKGRFYPQLAKSLMNYAATKKGDTILDPFCGCGTTLVESLLYGVNAIGLDINPLAYIMAKAKVKSLLMVRDDFDCIKKSFCEINEDSEWNKIIIDRYLGRFDVEYLRKWFPENNLKKILFIQEIVRILGNENQQLFSKVILSNLLREYSLQDPKQLRIRRRIDTPPENLIDIFKENLFQHISDLEKFQEINNIEFQSNIDIHLGDIRKLTKDTNLKEKSIDTIITSPPYATALPYIDTDRLSLFAFGLTNSKTHKKLEESLIGNREIKKSKRELLDQELETNFKKSLLPGDIISLLRKIYRLNKTFDVGFRRKNTASLLYKYFLDMHFGIKQVSYVLKKNKFAFFVVGNNKTKAGNEEIKIPTDDFIAQIAENNNLKFTEKINLFVQKPYEIHSKNAINTESILIFKKI
jgi:tRNA G10  N-methylase Trm11